jgi:drug/metabolite transporter (DMT)-like permease
MLAPALALGASVAWGGSDFAAGLASRKLPLLAVLLGSQAAGLMLLLGLLAVSGDAPPPTSGALAAVAAGVVELIGFAALYKALAIGPMSVVAPISSAAAIVPVTASVAAGERPATAVALGMGLALVGAALACAERGDDDPRRVGRLVPGAALALVSALCFGAFFVAMNAATDEAGPVWAVALNRSTSVAVLLVAVAIVRPRVGVRRADLAAVASVGVLDGAANALFAFALTQGLTSTVSVLGSLYPVTTVVLAVLLLDERIARRQAAGLTTVLAGIALVSAHP